MSFDEFLKLAEILKWPAVAYVVPPPAVAP